MIIIPREDKSKVTATAKVEINLYLLAITFTLFTFIIAINPALIRDNAYLSLQLTLAIPLLISSTFARTKLIHREKPSVWATYGFVTFILAYAFLINVVGILLSTLVSTRIGMVFWGVNIVLSLLYFSLEVIEDNDKVSSRVWKDIVFIAIILAGGLLPVLGVY